MTSPAHATRLRRRRHPGNKIWWFILPALIPYLFVVIIPSIQGAGFAFTDWDGLNPNWTFTGLDNFTRMFADGQAMRALFNTLALAIGATIVENVLGLLLALGLNTHIKSKHVLRLVFFVPVVIITIVVAFIWQFIYTPGGPLNEILRGAGLGALAQNWLGNPDIALSSIGVIMI